MRVCRDRSIGQGLVLLGLIPLLAACASGHGPRPSYSELRAAYADEPHEVRLVDRSRFEEHFQPRLVSAPHGAAPGSILIYTRERALYFINHDGTAHRYGIAVGAPAHAWSGVARIGRKEKWPAWHPTEEMRMEAPGLPRRIEPGPHNPLGARALYLYQDGRDTLYRIHGTSEPWTIGTEVSSGCIRMLNEDVIDLYERVEIGAMVKVI